ncbi:MAG: hypothetical protein P8X96_01120 [Desulfobacteraceae bacterium]
MDFDSIFTLIIIFIAILSLLGKLKNKPKSGQGAKPKGAGGWIERLNAFLDDLQKRVESQSKGDDAPTADQWRELMDETTTIKPRPASVESKGLELDFVEEPVAVWKKHPASSNRRKAKRPVEAPLIAEVTRQPMRRHRKSLGILVPIKKNELRKAIVMAEILGPPLALRAQSHERKL